LVPDVAKTVGLRDGLLQRAPMARDEDSPDFCSHPRVVAAGWSPGSGRRRRPLKGADLLWLGLLCDEGGVQAEPEELRACGAVCSLIFQI
jgi:hypothetical protein